MGSRKKREAVVKEGDEVAVLDGIDRVEYLSKVEQVTHDGTVAWVDGNRFPADGRVQRTYPYRKLAVATDEHRAEVRRRTLVRSICRTVEQEKIKHLPLDVLEQVATLMGI